MSERKYALHSTKDCTSVRTKRYTKDGMGIPIGSRNHAMKQHNKSENKWKKDLKSLKKHNKMLYSISKKSGSRREIKNINRIRSEASKKTGVSSSEDWDSNSLLAINSIRDKHIRPAGCKEINKLYHVLKKPKGL